ncbi:dnaJ homolog subfamily C member 17-like [Ylistrum balloti]|uniref:dnaJ homolog subfamily C member 17-like n=1 Tax=Ylistrum balloti TaxID=509963 RepID=UPI002905EFAE|nr:dnaJ homolog subfamily C member 17-like [Ylistrum balloti]
MTTPTLDVSKLDLYAILSVDENATEKEIVKAYRKQALKWHPDKNPDNPEAVEVFHKLSKALEILTDAPARVAYDKIQKAKKAAEKRHKELDSKRKKLKEDLEFRENAAQSQKDLDISVKKNFQAEIERLRKEGSKLLQKEQELLQEELRKTAEAKQVDDEEEVVTPKLKVKWKAKKGDESNGGYSYTVLHTMFSKYGDVLNLLVSSKKNGSAILELSSRYAAETAVQNEIGLAENPLTLTWLEGHSPPLGSAAAAEVQSQPCNSENRTENRFEIPEEAKGDKGENWLPYQSTAERDYESLVLMKMRQAQERQRLIEQMKKEDEDT